MLSARAWALLEQLADGKFHSGEALAHQFGISRASVCNDLADVAASGIILQRIRGRGYRLAHRWERLAADQIVRLLGDKAGQFDIEVLGHGSSSNALLLQRAASMTANGKSPGCTVLAIEWQTAGRGRLGRTWHSSLGDTLTFSVLWRFDCGLNALSGLSLSVGVAVVRALATFGACGVQLKWPNDIVTTQGKLAGVLIEAQGDMLGPSTVVIGIGLNFHMSQRLAQRIDQPAVALDEICEAMPSRNQFLATLLLELESVLRQFAQNGFTVLRDEWQRHHARQNQAILMHLPNGHAVHGTALGVSDLGELRVDTAHGIRQFNSGEVGDAR